MCIAMSQQHSCCVYLGDDLASYGFGNDHPFGPMRHHVFEQEFYKQSLHEKVDILPPQTIDQSVLELFHTHDCQWYLQSPNAKALKTMLIRLTS